MASEIPVKFGISAVWDDARKTFSDVNRGLEKLGDSVKGYGREQREQAKNARLFAAELNAFLPAGDAASRAITNLAASFVGGVGLGTGLEIAKIGFEFFSARAAEAEQRAAKLSAEIDKLGASIRTAGEARSITKLTRNMDPERGRLEKELIEAQARQREAEALSAKQRRETGETIFATENAVGQARIQVAQITEEIVAWEKQHAGYSQYIEDINTRAVKNAEARWAAEKKVADAIFDQWIHTEALNDARRRALEDSLGPVGSTFKPDSRSSTSPFSQFATGADFRPSIEDLSALTPQADFNSPESKKAWEDMQAEITRTRSMAEGAGEAIGAALAQSFQSGSEGAIGFGKVVLDQVLMAVQARAVEAAATSASSIPFPANVALAAASFAFVRGMIAQIPARAEGGPVYAGQPYMVGERGPELVVPGASGTVIPNHKLGGQSLTIVATDAKSLARQLEDVDSRLSRAVRSSMRRPRV